MRMTRKVAKRAFVPLLAFCLMLTGLVACQTDNGQTSTGTSTNPDTAINQPNSDLAASGPVTFTDDLGNQVSVDNPQRVVATMGSFAKIWELAGGTLVGASDDAFTYRGYQLSSPDIARVGDFSAINLESIIALEPDFVIMTSATTGIGRSGAVNQVDLKDTLEASGITVAYFNITTFPDYLRMLNTCCQITGRSDLYQTNGEAVKAQIDSLIASVPSDAVKPRILLMTTYSGGTRVQGSTTQTGAMLSDLGVVNIADENPSLLSDFSLEAVVDSNPDFIFVVPTGVDTEAAMQTLTEATEANPAWNQLSAVQDGKYIVLDPALYQYKPNEKWGEAYQALYDDLYTK